jgi:serine/threonine protein kinase
MNLKTGYQLAGGRYRVERVLGQGVFGITYEARDTKFKSRVKSVAIKEFFVKDFCNREEETNRIIVATQSKVELVKKLRNKFIDEANALFELEHPGIVRVTDTFEENGTAYYVMEYINGSSLSNIVETEGPLNEDMALGYIRQTASALEYLHGQNRLHLDINPQNIMVDNYGRVVLIGFGVSKQYDEVNGENTSTLLGSTPGYAPIEQSGSGVSEFYPSTDIYSLGATLYKLLTGNTPLPAHQLASGETLPPLPHSVSAATRKAVECAMSLNRNNRPQNISEFLSLLECHSEQKPVISTERSGGEISNTDDGATEILHSVQDDKYRENSSSTPGGEVSRSDGGEEHGNVTASDANQSGKQKDENGEQKILHSAQNDKKHPDDNTTKRTSNKRLITIISVAAICIIAAIFGIKSCNDRKTAEAEAQRTTAIAEQQRIDADRKTAEAEAKQQIETLFVPLLDRVTGKYGFVDPTGKLAIPCKYDGAVSFSEDLVWVLLDGVGFYIDKNGKEYIK